MLPAHRLQKVAFVLSRHGFGEVVARLGLGLGLARRDDQQARRRVGERLARVLSDLGPTYIKLGQLLATREDVLPPEVTTALKQLQQNVPPMPSRVALRTMRRALGDDLDRAFAWIDSEPLAAASIGQVHAARLRSGEQVVIKVQRPGLRELVAADLQILRFVAATLSRAMPEVAAIDPLPLLDAFERSLTAELDFRGEATNAAKLSALLAGAPEVRVPRVHQALTRQTVLVMERVHGRRLDKLDVAGRADARARLLRAFTRQILDHGVFHADPHPGNVMVEGDGRLVLLDLGAVDALDAPLRSGLARLVRAMALGRKRALCDAVLALSPDGATVAIDRAALELELKALLDEARGAADGARLMGEMVAIGRRHKLKLSPSLVALVRALALLDGVLRGLDPARDLVADLRRELLASLLRWLRRLPARVTSGLRALVPASALTRTGRLWRVGRRKIASIFAPLGQAARSAWAWWTMRPIDTPTPLLPRPRSRPATLS